MLGDKIKSSDDKEESIVRPTVVNAEKRTDQWSLMLVSAWLKQNLLAKK